MKIQNKYVGVDSEKLQNKSIMLNLQLFYHRIFRCFVFMDICQLVIYEVYYLGSFTFLRMMKNMFCSFGAGLLRGSHLGSIITLEYILIYCVK